MKTGRKVAVVAGIVAAIVGGIWALTKKVAAVPPEDIVLSNLSITPSEVYIGEAVTITITATNIGGTAGSYTITCEVI